MQDKKINNLPSEYGIIALSIAKIFRLLQNLPLQVFIGNRVDAFNKTDFQNLTIEEKKAIAIKRSRQIDIYILCFLFIEFSSIIISQSPAGQNPIIKYLIIILAILRITDIIQVNVNLSLFDIIRIGKPFNYMASVVRTIANVFINYFEMILCFGIIYSYNVNSLTNISHWSDSYYYSITTQTTFGFGEIIPSGVIKWVTCLQLILGYFFTALIISRFISLLPQSKSIVGDSQSDSDLTGDKSESSANTKTRSQGAEVKDIDSKTINES